MNRSIYVCTDQEGYNQVADLLAKGWVLDPRLTSGKPFVLDAATVWPLVKFDTSEEQKEWLGGSRTLGTEAESLVLVDIRQADNYLRQGYLIYVQPTNSSKQVILVKPKSQELNPAVQVLPDWARRLGHPLNGHSYELVDGVVYCYCPKAGGKLKIGRTRPDFGDGDPCECPLY